MTKVSSIGPIGTDGEVPQMSGEIIVFGSVPPPLIVDGGDSTDQ